MDIEKLFKEKVNDALACDGVKYYTAVDLAEKMMYFRAAYYFETVEEIRNAVDKISDISHEMRMNRR